MTTHKTEYIDADGNKYYLLPLEQLKGQRACQGCSLGFGNSNACSSAPSCTPTIFVKGQGNRPILKGKHVWVREDRLKTIFGDNIPLFRKMK